MTVRELITELSKLTDEQKALEIVAGCDSEYYIYETNKIVYNDEAKRIEIRDTL